MPRYIDADALLEQIQFRLSIENKNAEVISGCVDITRRIIDNAPTVDAVEVVRCRECKYWECGDCYRLELSRTDDFCSYGERRNDVEQG